nr:hypothetical protein [uncultured Draconibacterium sp.]
MHQPDQKSDCSIRKGEKPNGSAIVPAENANVPPGNVIVLPENAIVPPESVILLAGNAIVPPERVIIPVGKRKNHSGMPHNDVNSRFRLVFRPSRFLKTLKV